MGHEHDTRFWTWRDFFSQWMDSVFAFSGRPSLGARYLASRDGHAAPCVTFIILPQAIADSISSIDSLRELASFSWYFMLLLLLCASANEVAIPCQHARHENWVKIYNQTRGGISANTTQYNTTGRTVKKQIEGPWTILRSFTDPSWHCPNRTAALPLSPSAPRLYEGST